MDTSRRLLLLTIAALLSVVLVSAPALAVDEPADGGSTEETPADDGDDRIALVDTPRDRLGLLLIGAMLTAGAIAAVNMRRQLKGGRPQASGEFRWR